MAPRPQVGTRPQVRFQRSDTIEQTQRVLEDRLKPVSDCPLISGRLIENIALPAAAATTIEHKLGRTPRGWIVTDSRDASNPTLFLERFAWDDKTLVLYNDMAGDRTISLWVF